ncbi:MarR family winged helix-turn-helix transcriptional regulator [Hymenobacter psychrophilus]|uniref:DNA-binding transcriptional regulator, MarR family n=1 Tax=Hymenobacter psychrophilus TaxID=651662 RepID=A0A1H3MWW5_9BACT|nr:MarR family transcriptional regulator [Hymenobacter psychrophilus]SDY80988.1 DNA-binding transcriptional regulator, MarR family [Hymenobacter psychrophilus]
MKPDNPTQTALYTLEQAIKAYRRLCQQNIDRVAANLTVDQALTLVVLNKHPELSQQQLAELVFKDKASLTRMLELLVQKNLVARALHASDRRKFSLTLTPQGQQLLEQLTATIALNQQTALQGLTETELTQFHATLQKIIINCATPSLCV